MNGALTPNLGTGPSSLAQLFTEHELRCVGPAEAPNISLNHSSSSSLSSICGVSLSEGLSFPASLGCPTSVSPASSLLSCSLSSLSLQDSKKAGPLPVPLGSLSKPVEVGGLGKSPGVGGQDGSPSLAELIQEHQSNSPDLFNSVPGLKNPSALMASSLCNADTPKTPQHNILGLINLPTLPLPKPNAPPPGFPVAPSGLLSERQAAAPELQNRAPLTSERGKRNTVQAKQPFKPQNVDLSVLMAQSSPEPPSPRLNSRSPVSPCSSRPMNPSLLGVFAEPSVFARTICVQLRKKRSQGGRTDRQASSYCKQAARAKERVQGPPLHHITPFKFDTPSPDDIVKANQKKAFTRE